MRMIAIFLGAWLTLSPALTGAEASAAPVGARSLPELAAAYGVSPAQVQDLRQKNWAWYDVAYALVLIRCSGRPLIAVLWLRDSGHSWLQIAERLGCDKDQATVEARKLETEFFYAAG